MEVELAVVRGADRLGEQLGSRGRHDHAAVDLAGDACGLALRVSDDDHRPADGEDAVHAARDDEAGEAAAEPDHVDVRRRQRLGEPLARLVGQEHDLDLEPLGERDEICMAGARADHDAAEIVEVAQERQRARQCLEILRVADVARVHHDEAADEVVLLRPGVVARSRRER